MSVAIRSPLLALAPDARALAGGARAGEDGPTLSALEWVLHDQQVLTAVDRFAKKHDAAELLSGLRTYRELIPPSKPIWTFAPDARPA
jgi:hypothetical protein